MKKSLRKFILSLFAGALGLSIAVSPVTSFAQSSEEESAESAEAGETITITDVRGEVEVPVNPKSVVALDNRTFTTLADWGVEVKAVPKDVMDAGNPYVSDESIANVGNHREPKLEVIAEANPDLIIVGQRFAKYYDEIKELCPDAAVVDFTIDVSDTSDAPGENLVNYFVSLTEALGQIFQKEDEAAKLIEDFNKAKDRAIEAYDGESTVLAVNVSGGEIGFVAPRFGRVWGPLYDVIGFKPALEVDEASDDHKGDDISVEAIAEANPDWLLVLDRDAAVSSAEDAPSAADAIEGSEALANTTAIKEDNLVYAPNNMYTSESIQNFTILFNELADAFEK